MDHSQRASRNRFIRKAPGISICSALFLVGLVCFWGLTSEMKHRRDGVYSAAIHEARSHAERTTFRLEIEIDEGLSVEDLRKESMPRWLVRHWYSFQGKPDRLYAAITDASHQILSHSSEFEGDAESARRELAKPPSEESGVQRLSADWDRQPMTQYGPRVHRTSDGCLTQGTDAIDIAVPFHHAGSVFGYYHAGIDYQWLEARVDKAQRNAIRGWLVIIASIAVIVLVSSISLYRLGAHTIELEQALRMAESRRLADLSRLIVGMAHELRNPLNAVRLNLFTSEKLIRGDSKMRQEDAVAMLRESVSEVERVEDLIGQLLGYARVDTQEQSWIAIDREITATLQFMSQVHEHHHVEIRYENSCPNLEIRIDRKYFRQCILNLLHNARQAMADGGLIRIQISSAEGTATILIEDSGPGIAVDQYDRIFEPFYTTRQDGVGLGLAVVKSLVENAGGNIVCRRSWTLGGMAFAIQLPSRDAPLPLVPNKETTQPHEHSTIHSGH
jgi:two-component system, NtrC family, sensor histidine kinase HydH